MTKLLYAHKHVFFLVLLLVAATKIAAQPQAYNWKFGSKCGISFSPGGGAPTVDLPGPMEANEGCASISDAAGVLQCYTNGLQVWDRLHNLMPNGQLTGGHLSATQGALLLQFPGQVSKYYLFTIDAYENRHLNGLRYSVIDMSLRGGLGDVGPVKSVPVSVPAGALLTEKLTAVRHANGRDFWIVTHGWQNNSFYAYLLSPNGLAATPVVSSVGAVHTGTMPTVDNSIGYLRASPNSLVLASAQLFVGVELFDFEPASGRISNVRAVPGFATTYYGLEFSPDNSKLYVSDGTSAYQLDLANNLAKTTLNTGGRSAQGLQRGPDGQVYISFSYNFYLGSIRLPNLAGAACNLDPSAVVLSPANVPGAPRAGIGLPNFPNAFTAPLGILSAAAAVCPGTPVAFSAFTTLTGYTYTWNFGDAGSPTNMATGLAASHSYAQPGTYTVLLTATSPAGGTAYTGQQTVVVNSLPTLSLGARQRILCAGQSLVLSASAQAAGTTYQWQDGTTSPTYLVRASGRYRLTVASPSGCLARDSVDVTVVPLPTLRLAPPAVLCPDAPPLVLRPNAQSAGTTYQWQDGTTTETYVVRQPGRYRLLVRTAAGCTAADSVEVRGPQADGECEPIAIPNIITPNGDSQNDFFVLKGLLPATWNVRIYNRWGHSVFQQDRYDNRWDAPGLPAGLYYYLLQNPANGQQRQGWVEVLR